MQTRPSFWHSALSSFGSAETQRGEEAVSGNRMPTLLFFAAVLPELLLLLLQAETPATASATAVAIVKTLRGVLRIAACLLPSRVALGMRRHAAGVLSLVAISCR